MGMGNIKVFGIVTADDNYKKKLAAYNACREAKIGIPEELREFFNYNEPSSLGEEIHLGAFCVEVLDEDYKDGCIINLSKISTNVKFIKIIVTY